MTDLEISPLRAIHREFPSLPRRFRRFTLRTASLEAAWREVEQLVLGDTANQSAVTVATPRYGDDLTIATTEQGSRAPQSMLGRWQRQAMSPLSTPEAARLAARNSSDLCPTHLSTDDRCLSATARCRFSSARLGSATEMSTTYRAVCPEEQNHAAL